MASAAPAMATAQPPVASATPPAAEKPPAANPPPAAAKPPGTPPQRPAAADEPSAPEDSKLSVQWSESGTYLILLRLEQLAQNLVIAQYTPRVQTSSPRLPILIEGVITEESALVHIKYDPDIIQLTIDQTDIEVLGQLIQVRATRVPAAELLVTTPPVK